MLLEGIFLSLTTPFHPDGRIRLAKLESNVSRYSLTPAAGLVIGGANGEASALTDDDLCRVLQSAITSAAREKVMLAFVGRESVFATLQLAAVAADAGYDAIVVRPPRFATNQAMTVEATTFFRTVADQSRLPVVLSCDASANLAVDVIAALATHPNIIGLVDDSGDTLHLAAVVAATRAQIRFVTVTSIFAAVTGRMLHHRATDGSFVSASSLGSGSATTALTAPPALKTRSKQVGFQVLTGTSASMLEHWQAGASGAVPNLGPAAPQACCEVWQAYKDGDGALAEEKQERIRLIAISMEGPAGVAAIKHACDLNGYFGGRPRLPLLPLTENEQVGVEERLSGMRN